MYDNMCVSYAGTNIEQRFQYLYGRVQAFMRAQNKLHMQRVNQETMGIEGMVKCPMGAWQKGQDTRWLMVFLQHWLRENHTGEFTHIELRATSINLCFSTLYSSGLWLTRYEANLAATAGLDFLKYYNLLAAESLRQGKDRFPMALNLHNLAHVFYGSQVQSSSFAWSLNPLCYSVQADKDFWPRFSTFLHVSLYVCCVY